ncbi:MAG: hypothetical protein LBE76_09380, partial [Nitrososphaerota archaeon]|nr:hypothetical protein [Nitrososphaerota archaeon]
FITLNCSQFCASSIMFLMVILKVAALQKEEQTKYINSLTIKNTGNNDLAFYCICTPKFTQKQYFNGEPTNQ